MKIIGIYMGVTLVSDHKDKPDIDSVTQRSYKNRRLYALDSSVKAPIKS